MVGMQDCASFPLALDESNEPRRIGEAVVAKYDGGAARPGLQPFDTGRAAVKLDSHHAKQVLRFLRQRTETIDQLRGKGFYVGSAFDLTETAVESEPNT